jgi:DNA replication protein DnaC
MKTVEIEYNCKECKDKGYIDIEDKGYTFTKKCECAKREQLKRVKERDLKSLGLPDYLHSKTFQNFNRDEHTKDIYNKVYKYALDGKSNNLLLYSSHYGCGKTHLAISVLLESYKTRVCAYVNSPKLFTEIQHNAFKDFKQKAEALKLADLLILDDITCSKPAEWKHDFYYEILDERYYKEKETIITANLSEPVELAEYIGKPTFDRFAGRAIIIKFPTVIKSKRFNS